MDKSFSFLKNKVIPLHNENTFLRPLAADKIPPEYVRWMGDSEVIRFTEQRFQIASEKSIKDYVSQMNNSDNNLFYGVFFGNKIIGTVKLGEINKNHKTANVSYLIGAKEYWGRGIASASISELVKIAFLDLDIVKVCAGVYENNIPSIKALEKNGFVLEGRRESQVSFEDMRISALFYGKSKY